MQLDNIIRIDFFQYFKGEYSTLPYVDLGGLLEVNVVFREIADRREDSIQHNE